MPTLAANEGEELFVERARAAGVELDVDDTISELCRRLDELPLAIELAAARTPLFSPEGLLERVGSRLDLLRGRRDSDPRQATLRATIDWSYELLDDARGGSSRQLRCSSTAASTTRHTRLQALTLTRCSL